MSEGMAAKKEASQYGLEQHVPTYFQEKRGIPWAAQLLVLFRIQFSAIRDTWMWVFVMASLFPLCNMLFLKFFYPLDEPAVIVRIITGNMVFAITLMGITMLAQDVSWQKHQGHFGFYASLPISKLSFVAAIMLRGLITTLPSVIILCLLGQLVFGVKFHYSVGLIPLVFVAMLSSVGFGAALGFWSPNYHLTNLMSQILVMFITFLTPVIVDVERLPLLLRWISALLPTTYAASAFRSLFGHGWNPAAAKDMGILALFSLASLWLIQTKVSWRIDS